MENDVINVEFDVQDTHMSIAKAMTQDYSSIFIIDPLNEDLILYKSNMKYKPLVKVAEDSPRYSEAMNNYIEKYKKYVCIIYKGWCRLYHYSSSGLSSIIR